MGLFGGSTTTTTNENFDTGPSSFQKPYLTGVFNDAQNGYNSQAGTPYYQGETYAGMSDQAKAALQAMQGYATGTGLGTANTLSSIGSNLAGYAGKAGGLIDNYLTASSPDAITAAASKYAANPYIQQQIDAAAGDVTRNLNENTLPAIDRGASSSGNINSSRTGIAAGIAQRGAQTDISNLAANIRGNAWNTGLGLARDSANAGLTAANAYSGLGNDGISAMQAGANAGYGAYNVINAANQQDQADQQGQDDAAFSKWQGDDQRQWDLLNRYNSIIGGQQWGQSGTSSGTSVQKTSGSVLGGILGALSTGVGIAKTAGISDPRLKKCIRKISQFLDGLGIYVWSYVWEPDHVVHIGVMSNEVQEVRPWALGDTINGYQTVNYAKL